jgi:hypothetical protein
MCYNVEFVDRNTFLLDDYYNHQCVDNDSGFVHLSCVPIAVSVSGWSILDCPFGFL